MAEFNSSDVIKTAHLARLAIDETSIESYAQDLSKILDLVEQFNAVDTSNITPMSHPLDVAQRLRPDTVTETNQQQQAMPLAPNAEAGLFLVPQVIEE